MSVPVSTYAGPALPLGDSFEGIVHLHGVVPMSSNQSIVLTDRDFGKAYITLGWAASFLVRMFEKYTVLFVGYSGDDTVMRYLTRALPPKTEAYAFAEVGKEEGWRRLGITPVTYPPVDNHRALPEAINAWVKRATAMPLEKQRRVSSIAARTPPLGPIDSTYIDWALSRPETLRYFLDAAKPHVWVNWLSDNGYLTSVLSSREPDDCAQLWSSWLAEMMKTEHAGDLLVLLQKSEVASGSLIWWDVWRSLASSYSDVPNARQYLLMLISTAGDEYAERLSSMLPELVEADRFAGLHAFEFLLQVKSVVSKGYSFLVEGWPVQLNVSVLGETYWLRQAWEILRASLEDDAERLISCTLFQIVSAVNAHRLFDGVDGRDAISRHRQVVGVNVDDDQFADSGGIDILIDVARDALRAKVEAGPSKTLHYLDELLGHDYDIVRRLAVDALGYGEAYQSDKAIGLILKHRLLFDHELKPEIFALLKAKYGSASPAVRQRVIRKALTGRVGYDRPSSNRYVRFNLLYWLTTCAPDDRTTKISFEKIQEQNPTFLPREHPNLHSWITAGAWARDDFQATGVLRGRDSSDAVDSFPAESANSVSGDIAVINWTKEVLLACADRPLGFVVEVLIELCRREIWNIDAWSSLLNLLADREGLEISTEVLELVLRNPNSPKLSTQVRRMQEKYWSSLQENSSTDDELRRQLQMIFSLWEEASDNDPPRDASLGPTLDWAINEPRGDLTLTYLNGLIKLVNRLVEANVDAIQKSALEEMIKTSSLVGDPSAVILGGQPSWLLAMERDWCVSHLVPRFDWSRSGEYSAAKFWEGFLHWGRWTPDLADLLAGIMRVSLPQIRRNLPKSVHAFIRHHAALFMFFPNDVTDVHWPDALINAAHSRELTQWNEALVRLLESDDEPRQVEVWSKFSGYWRRRIDGLPKPLKADEVSILAKCLFAKGVKVAEVADLLMDSPLCAPSRSGHTRHKIFEALPVDADPASSATIIARLLRAETHAGYNDTSLIAIARRLHELKAPDASKVVQELIRLGVFGAVELAAEIENGESD